MLFFRNESPPASTRSRGNLDLARSCLRSAIPVSRSTPGGLDHRNQRTRQEQEQTRQGSVPGGVRSQLGVTYDTIFCKILVRGVPSLSSSTTPSTWPGIDRHTKLIDLHIQAHRSMVESIADLDVSGSPKSKPSSKGCSICRDGLDL